jgi:class 3 adenylate cyclase/predicted ATPase/ABC-type transport system involved in cytochrome c biogenesis ATPase subunit
MDFDALLGEAIALLQRRGRLTHAGLKRQFGLDDPLFADLKDELVLGQRVAQEEGGQVLVWTGPAAVAGGTAATVATVAATVAASAPAERTLPIGGAERTLPIGGAERRQLTVMFCDLIGSTQLSAQLDPEDYREILAGYHLICQRVIERYEGHVCQRLGDGVLAYFGWPRAHEDDARRAVKSALAIPTALAEVARGLAALGGARLQVRVGIHTGLVVVGETGNERLAMGETPNVAARLQGMATADGVLLSGATRRLLGADFELKALGAQQGKGMSEPIEVFQALWEHDAHEVLDSVVSSEAPASLVGREVELQLLADRWQAARRQSGQVVLVCGDPGIGKTRLLRTLQQQVQADGGAVKVMRCSPYHLSSVLHPVLERLRKDAGLLAEDSPETLRQGLAAWAGQMGFDADDALQPLLTLCGHGEETLSAGRRRHLHELLVRWLLLLSERRALCLVVEDLHWADPSTLELLGLLMDQVPAARMLLLLSYRPEFQPPWHHAAHRVQLHLSRFQPAQIERLVLQVSGGRRLPAELLHQIVQQTDGVPLYVEEVTKLLLEGDQLVADGDHFRLKDALVPLRIPSTLRDSLMARLDRQHPGREVAQLGAVVGREFNQPLIEALWGQSSAALYEGLAQLVEAELLQRRGLGAGARYLFKHVMLQEVAYESLLRRTREDYHARIVQVLEERFPDIGAAQPEVLAHHYTGAGHLEHAIPLWLQAAERAIETSSHAEAIAHVTKAIELQGLLPVDGNLEDKLRSEITLQIRLGVSLTALRGYGAEEVERAYARARELCYRINAQDLLLPSVYGLWRFHLMRADYAGAGGLSQELLQLARRFDSPEFLVVGQRALGSSLFYTGKLQAARAAMDEVLSLPADQHQRVQAFRYDVVDARVTAAAYRAWCAWLMGDDAAALRDSEQAITTARELQHPFSHALSLSFAGWMHQFRGELSALRAAAMEALVIAHEHGFEFWIGWNEALLGWARAIEGDAAGGARQVAAGIQRWMGTGSQLGRSYFMALQVQALMRAEQWDEADAVLHEGLAFVERSGERFWEADLHRQRALWLQARGGSAAEILAARERALQVANEQGALALVKRCELSAQRSTP